MEQSFDISDFRLKDDDPRCYYMFAVITETPEWWDCGFGWWARFRNWLSRSRERYVYFHVGQIVVCDTGENFASPRETPWGAKPGKHDCMIESFTDLGKAITFAREIVNKEISGE